MGGEEGAPTPLSYSPHKGHHNELLSEGGIMTKAALWLLVEGAMESRVGIHNFFFKQQKNNFVWWLGMVVISQKIIMHVTISH